MDASMTMAMNMGTTTTAAAAASATSTMSKGMGMDMGSSCKISMLWNWYTINACFISTSWHITSKGMFAGSCIGVILLVMSLEFLRRVSREYDGYIVAQEKSKQRQFEPERSAGRTLSDDNSTTKAIPVIANASTFRPSVLQQAIRALLHMLQFAVAYFIMLLAMYYNGYIIISIIIGAFLGSFVFSWEFIRLGSDDKKEATLCCG